MRSQRGIGSRGSQTRTRIVRCTEQLMLELGYAAVTYRGVATGAGVAPGLVQYYFPMLDDLFMAVLRSGTDRAVERLARASTADQPLRAVWEYANNKAGTALLLEFMALANHRKAIAPVIGEGGERVRQALLATLTTVWDRYGLSDDEMSPAALVFLMSAIPRMIHLEETFGTY